MTIIPGGGAPNLGQGVYRHAVSRGGETGRERPFCLRLICNISATVRMYTNAYNSLPAFGYVHYLLGTANGRHFSTNGAFEAARKRLVRRGCEGAVPRGRAPVLPPPPPVAPLHKGGRQSGGRSLVRGTDGVWDTFSEIAWLTGLAIKRKQGENGDFREESHSQKTLKISHYFPLFPLFW